MQEALSSVKIQDPPLFVKYNSKLFGAWYQWATHYEEPTGGKIRPMGERIGPSWLQFKFGGLEDFYNYYLNLLEQEL